MQHIAGIVLVWLLLSQSARPELDLVRLREVLEDRQDPRGQSQAALMLVQSADAGAVKLVRLGLRQTENEEMFLALAAAVRLRQDTRFLDDLLDALTANRPRLRQVIAETLASLSHPGLVKRLDAIAAESRNEIRVRQTAAWTLGRTGQKTAAAALMGLLGTDNEELRRVVASALSELSGQAHGLEIERWKSWWDRHKGQTAEQWLEMRLAYQSGRAARLEGELLRSRAQVLRLHQQLYARLPVPDRLAYLQAAVDQEDVGLRALAVVWCLELLPGADASRHKLLANLLLQLTKDGVAEVQRGAVLALGRVGDESAFERLGELLGSKTPAVRAAAARALAQVTRTGDAAVRARQKEVIASLQKALEDRIVDVVIEAAEALGSLGAPEAGPVLLGLLRHPSEHVRQTAAQALERAADASLLDGLVKGLDDANVTVRFSLLGAASKAANGQNLSTDQRKRLLDRLKLLLEKDGDQGVRSRAATVLGEVADASMLPILWAQVQSAGEGRVQEKAWDALVEIILRDGTVVLLAKWDRTLADAKQPSRRVQLLARAFARWDQQTNGRAAATKALESLVVVQLELGKWASAAPLLPNLLSRAGEGGEGLRERCLKQMLRVAEMALEEGNRVEAARLAQEGRGYLAKDDPLMPAFEKVHKAATRKE